MPVPVPVRARGQAVVPVEDAVQREARIRMSASMQRAPTLRTLEQRGFELRYLSHAKAILNEDFPEAEGVIAAALDTLTLPVSEIIGSGGGITKFTQRLRADLHYAGWLKHEFIISKVVDGTPRESTSHEVDHVRRFEAGVIACEIEWNNKDPFFDRDLENFKRLHAEGAISLGILITRGSTLQAQLHGAIQEFARRRGIDSFEALGRIGIPLTNPQRANIERRMRPDRRHGAMTFADAWAEMFYSSKYGLATTHWDKLAVRVDRGVGNPCPLLLIGIPAAILVQDEALVEVLPENADQAPPAP